MAITLDTTGILQAAAFWVSNKGGSNGRRLYFYFYILLTLISLVVGNDPVIRGFHVYLSVIQHVPSLTHLSVSGTAFLVYYTDVIELNPVAWLMSEFAAANTASMVLFVGNPTNVVICEGFRINNAAFTAYTMLPFLACSVACLFGLAIQFRGKKYIPQVLNVTGKLNPREVLRDPLNALVGSILLASCLAIVIMLSFFHIDVWMVVLPFALLKFFIDIALDHRRHLIAKAKPEAVRPVAVDLKRIIKRSMTLPDSISDSVEFKTPSTHDATPTDSDNTRTTLEKGRRLFEETRLNCKVDEKYNSLALHFPTVFTAIPRLPFGLIVFAFSQFILIEALVNQGWIDLFAKWLVKVSHNQMISTIWIIGVVGILLCNIAGTNIGATILLTKVINAAHMPSDTTRAAAVSLAVASNIGAVSFTFSASLAGLLWDSILQQMNVKKITQLKFALWNALPLLLMTGAGLGTVTAEMVVHYR